MNPLAIAMREREHSTRPAGGAVVATREKANPSDERAADQRGAAELVGHDSARAEQVEGSDYQSAL
jgi:hypothetical protein